MQVMADIQLCPLEAQRRWTPGAVRGFLLAAVELTRLQPIGMPVVCTFERVIIGFQLIGESHIDAHLRSDCGLGWVDVFSCRDVAIDGVKGVIDEHLAGPGALVEIHVLPRGRLPASLTQISGGRPLEGGKENGVSDTA